MKKIMIAAAVFLASGLIPAVARAAESPTVIISEVAWAGSSLGTSDEWLELTNLSEVTVDLSGFTLEAAGTSGTALILPPGSVIEAHQTFLITNYATDDAKSALASSSQFVTTTLSLSNSALGVVLKDASGTILDQAGDGKTPKGGSSTAPFASMLRIDTTQDGSTVEAWMTANTSSGFDAGIADFGTPGIADFAFATTPAPEVPVEPTPEVIPEPVAVEETITEPVALEETIPEPVTPTETITEPEVVATEPVVTEETPVDPAPTEVLPVTEEPVETVIEPVTPTEPAPIISTPPGTLVVNELYPSPTTGGDEWVEIFNPYNNVIPLAGWKLRDGSGKLTALPDQLLGFGQFVLVSNPSGKLNNGSDAVALLDASGNVIDEVEYGTEETAAPKTGQALARENGMFAITTVPTPGAANTVLAPVTKSSSTHAPAALPSVIYDTPAPTVTPSAAAVSAAPVIAAVAPSKPTPIVVARPVSVTKPVVVAAKPAAKPKATAVSRAAAVTRVTLGDVRDLATGKKVSVTAIVTAQPGSFGTGTFAIADRTGGLLVERSSGALPALKVGDRVAIIGTVRISHGIRRIVLATSSGINVLGHDETVIPAAMAIENLDDGDVGSLITLTGEVTEQRGSLLKIAADDSTLALRLATDDAQTLSKGSRIAVSGILTSTGDTLRLQLRSADDLVIEAPPTASEQPLAAATTTGPQSNNGVRLVLASGVVLAALAAKHFIPLIKSHYVSTRPLRLAAQETD